MRSSTVAQSLCWMIWFLCGCVSGCFVVVVADEVGDAPLLMESNSVRPSNQIASLNAPPSLPITQPPHRPGNNDHHYLNPTPPAREGGGKRRRKCLKNVRHHKPCRRHAQQQQQQQRRAPPRPTPTRSTCSCRRARALADGPTSGASFVVAVVLGPAWAFERASERGAVDSSFARRACFISSRSRGRRPLQANHRFTVDPPRRLRQHNGEIGNGAARTKRSVLVGFDLCPSWAAGARAASGRGEKRTNTPRPTKITSLSVHPIKTTTKRQQQQRPPLGDGRGALRLPLPGGRPAV